MKKSYYDIHRKNPDARVTVAGYLHTMDGIDIGIRLDKKMGKWAATHIASGVLICDAKTRKELLETLPRYIAMFHDPRNAQRIADAIAAFETVERAYCEYDPYARKEKQHAPYKRGQFYIVQRDETRALYLKQVTGYVFEHSGHKLGIYNAGRKETAYHIYDIATGLAVPGTYFPGTIKDAYTRFFEYEQTRGIDGETIRITDADMYTRVFTEHLDCMCSGAEQLVNLANKQGIALPQDHPAYAFLSTHSDDETSVHAETPTEQPTEQSAETPEDTAAPACVTRALPAPKKPIALPAPDPATQADIDPAPATENPAIVRRVYVSEYRNEYTARKRMCSNYDYASYNGKYAA